MQQLYILKDLTNIEFRRFLREPVSLFFTLIFPLILLIIFGASYGSGDNSGGVPIYNSLVAIDTSFLIANFTLMGVAADLAVQKETGVSEAMRLLPLPSWLRFVAQSVAYCLILFISIAMMCVYVFTVYRSQIQFQGNPVMFVLAILASYIMFVCVARLVAVLPFSARALQLIGSSIFFILLFCSGVVIPIDSLPSMLQRVANVSPMYLTYKVLEGIWNDNMTTQLTVTFAVSLFICAVASVVLTRIIAYRVNKDR